VANKTPLKFDYDDTTPSALAEFTSSDTVPIINGGTGVSSLSNLGSIVAASVSATDLSGLTVNGMPYPPTFAYAQLTTNGTAEDSEQNIGVGADITSIESNGKHIQWNDTDKQFDVSAAGTYECVVRMVATVNATTDVTIKIKNNTDIKNSVVSRVHSSIDPTETTLFAVFTAASADTISATTTDDGTQDVTVISGTTLAVKRLL